MTSQSLGLFLSAITLYLSFSRGSQEEEKDRTWLEPEHITRFVCAKSAGSPSKEDAEISTFVVDARKRLGAENVEESALVQVGGVRAEERSPRTGKQERLTVRYRQTLGL